MEIDINRISLYLAGKLPPYYRAPFDKLELIELIRKHSPAWFSDDFFKLIDSQDFYSICLNRVERGESVDSSDKNTNNIFNILHELDIPSEVLSIDQSDGRWRPKNKEEFKVIIEQYDEIGATENIVAPLIFKKLWYAVPRWHKKRIDEYGHDFIIVPYQTPLFQRYLGIQVKKWVIRQNDIADIAKQIETGLMAKKLASDWTETTCHDFLLVSLTNFDEQSRVQIIGGVNAKNWQLLLWDIEDLYQLVLEYWLPQKPDPS